MVTVTCVQVEKFSIENELVFKCGAGPCIVETRPDTYLFMCISNQPFNC